MAGGPTRAAARRLAAGGAKFPSLYALANPLVGNPDLREETAVSGAAHLVWTSPEADRQVALSIFETRYEDLIDFDAGPPPRLLNRGEFKVRGFDLSGRLQAGDWRLEGDVSLARPILPEGAAPLRDRPEWRLGASLEWRASEEVQVAARARHIGERLGSSIPTGEVELAAYTVVDLTVDWRAAPGLRFQGSLQNLFDVDYAYSVGEPGLGFTPAVRARWEF
ncbi:MAG: TonB-dependent receptor domain-containing protein [Opitutales bacterium]